MHRLRPYQEAAVAAAATYIAAAAVCAEAGSPMGGGLLVEPTGAGKSTIIAEIARGAVASGLRVLVLTHVRELIAQVEETMHRQWGSELGRAPVGVYSAGLERRELGEVVTIAGIQSLYQVEVLPRYDVVVIDECHLLPRSGDGMYRSVLERIRGTNPGCCLLGLTATPYRLDSGMLHQGDDALFSAIIHETPISTLIDQGYLCPLRGRRGDGWIDTDGMTVRAGEFAADAVEEAVREHAPAARRCIMEHATGRAGILVFCAGVANAEMFAANLSAHGLEAACVTGATPDEERDEIIARFKARELRCIVNVGVLTTGFDATHVDLIALLRPTMSPGLYAQMVGRGMRIHPGKTDCLVLDFGGNIERHGAIVNLRPPRRGASRSNASGPASAERRCEGCNEYYHRLLPTCPACGMAPVVRPVDIAPASDLDPMVGGPMREDERVEVASMCWAWHTSRNSGKDMVRVDYDIGRLYPLKEFVCIEHDGYARSKAEQWWHEHIGGDCPSSTAAAMDAIRTAYAEGRLRRPTHLTIGPQRKNPKWDEIREKEFPPQAAEPIRVGRLVIDTTDNDVPF